MQDGHIEVTLHGERASTSRAVFQLLLENSVANERAPYLHALESGTIALTDLIALSRTAEVPYPLFFARESLVLAQLQIKTEKLLQGVSPDTFTVNTRTRVELHSIELIIKDLLRKQDLAKRHDATLAKNAVVGILRRAKGSPAEQAQTLVAALSLDRDAIRSARKKEDARELIIRCLESNQILVSRSVNGYMPQLVKVRFSGMTVRDTKVPYIFLAGGDHGDYEEPVGRQIFTLVLMAVLVARGIFAPVSYDASSAEPDGGLEYDITGEILMPAAELGKLDLDDLVAIKVAADVFKVTPSAVTVRALRLGWIEPAVAFAHLARLKEEFAGRTKTQARTPKPVNAVRRYSGRELIVRMLGAVDAHTLSARDFCRVVCLNRLRPSEIEDLRHAL